MQLVPVVRAFTAGLEATWRPSLCPHEPIPGLRPLPSWRIRATGGGRPGPTSTQTGAVVPRDERAPEQPKTDARHERHAVVCIAAARSLAFGAQRACPVSVRFAVCRSRSDSSPARAAGVV